MNLINRICWNITSNCNENCQFCFRASNDNELSLNQVIQAIDILMDYGITHITFSGGEALLNDNIFSIIDYCNVKNCTVNLISNGILIDENVLSKLDGKIVSLSLPIDAKEAMIENSKVIGRNNSQSEIVSRCLQLLRNHPNIAIKINTVATKLNYARLMDVYYGYIENNNQIKIWNIFEFTPLRCAAKVNASKFILDKTEFDNLKKSFILLNEDHIFRENLSIRIKSQQAIRDSYFVLSPSGNIVQNKDGVEEILANIFDRDLQKKLDNFQFDFESYKKRMQNSSLIIV